MSSTARQKRINKNSTAALLPRRLRSHARLRWRSKHSISAWKQDRLECLRDTHSRKENTGFGVSKKRQRPRVQLQSRPSPWSRKHNQLLPDLVLPRAAHHSRGRCLHLILREKTRRSKPTMISARTNNRQCLPLEHNRKHDCS